jgi:predicted transcriptional regulator
MELENQYAEILQTALAEIQNARIKIAQQVNVAANTVYWNLGKLLYEKKIEKDMGPQL